MNKFNESILSKFIIGSFFMSLIGCETSKHLTYATIYHGTSIEGLHGRSLTFVNDEAIIIGGPKGVFCGKFFGGDLVEQPAIQDAEDLRDVKIFKNGTISFLSSGDNGRMFHVDYHGHVVKAYDSAGVFLDGMDFWNDQNGIAYGDPVNGKFFLIETNNGGFKWQNLSAEKLPNALKNESGFAASGTGLICLGDSTVYFATGMSDTARIFMSYDRGKNWIVKNTPIKAGENFGIYSMAFKNENEGWIIGGSWKDIDYNNQICYYTNDAGNTWENRSKKLGGYSSCIVINKDASCIFTTGDKGTYFSLDKGITWELLFERNYYSIAILNDFAAFIGRDGAVEIIRFGIRLTEEN